MPPAALALKRDDERTDAWFERYLAAKAKSGIVTTEDITARLTRYVLPHIGALPIGEVTADVLRDVVRALDDRVRLARVTEGMRFSSKTAANVWGDVTAAFAEAVRSKDNALRVLLVDPTESVRGPDREEARAKPFLYPDEVQSLLACRDVPGRRRRLYAVAIYVGARASELAALEPSDVDLVHLRLQVTKQIDRRTRVEIRTKTRRTRDVDVELELVPLLHHLVVHPDGGKRLLHLPPAEDRAELVRRDLARAGCTRDALAADDASRSPFTFHRLRDTCLSHMAVRGDASHVIQWRAGHSTIAMTQKYIEAARRYERGFGSPFPPLPPDIAKG